MKTLRRLVFLWQSSIANAVSEFVNMEKIGHHYVMQYLHLKGLSSNNIKGELDSTLEEFPPSYTVKYWVAGYKRSPTSCPNEHRRDRPNEMTTPEMLKEINKMVLNDRRLKVCDVTDIVGISEKSKDSSFCMQGHGVFLKDARGIIFIDYL